jgi:2-polyprenyl-3-methyl-5-hydroxy-6-metoxy-1,4-benzoquinol methylase
MHSTNACALCHSTDTTPFDTTDAKNGKPLPMLLCHGCSLVQRAHIPSEAELHAYYSLHYRQDYKRTVAPRSKHVFRAGRAALDRLSFLEQSLEQSRAPHIGPRLTDIGAGGGEFVYLARRKGWDARGIEPNEGYADFARSAYGVTVETAHLDALESRSANIITLFHVLEHLPDPARAIAKIFHALEADGLLVIEVPNILQKDASPHNIYFAAHLFHFNIDTLKALTSPYFDLLHYDDSGNLKAVFQRKKQAEPAQWPSADTVADCLRRFHSKGWLQYLVAGRGALKPFKRIRRLIAEGRVQGQPARQILDTLLEQHTRRTTGTRPSRARQALHWLGGTTICALGVELFC